MDRCRAAPRFGSHPQTRRSLSVESLLRSEQRLESSADKSIELTSAVLRSDRSSGISRDSQQVSYNTRGGKTKSAHPSINDQAVLDQASNEEQTQMGRESRDRQKTEAQQTHKFNNSYESTPSEPLLVTSKTWRLGGSGDWIWEIASMVAAVCCLLAIFIILVKFNRQEQPSWLYARTLNLSTIIALLATFLRWMLANVLDAG